ncbi:hypothetical protein [Corallococcus sp. AS-1-6]|uniref:hypothetical protein n=1 Tax=Corallococcus sp. AS-1-6 TaxID=2874599 RepID=UPI001CBFFA0A|nr:hypothetical protein [Corallococcus sp. AS-1-6]MBZ4373458.1 hypothetical protein [Corallococcus sp. AS-1-6]
MADISLGDLLTLIFDDLADSIDRTSQEAGLRLQVKDVDLNVPAYLRLREAGTDPQEEPARFVLTLPSTRDSPAVTGVGRVAITLSVQSVGTTPEGP